MEFISFLREQVCVNHKKDLFFRGWDNWPSSAAYYLTMSEQIPTHPQFYFSIKHSAGDFTRPAQVSFQSFQNPGFLFKNPGFLLRNPDFQLKNVDFITKTQWNPQLGIGKHAQIVEYCKFREIETAAFLVLFSIENPAISIEIRSPPSSNPQHNVIETVHF